MQLHGVRICWEDCGNEKTRVMCWGGRITCEEKNVSTRKKTRKKRSSRREVSVLIGREISNYAVSLRAGVTECVG